MLFNTPQFFVFLAIVLILFYTAPRAWRKYILLAASYFFYMSFIPKFILLLLFLTAIDYTAARWIARTRLPQSRKAALVISLAANLGLLGFFKYYNFFAANIAQLFHRPSNAFALSIILPLGISFHTFQSMSYVIDVYRNEQEPITNPIDYALFISFFPQLVAGPDRPRARIFRRPLPLEAPVVRRHPARPAAVVARPGQEDGDGRSVRPNRQRLFPERFEAAGHGDCLVGRDRLRHPNLL